MGTTGAGMPRDLNHVPMTIDGYNREIAAPAAFTGATGNSRGDFAGTSNPLTLFTVTGDVIVRVFGVCTVNLASAGAGTLEVGTTKSTANLIAQTTGTDLDADEIWHDATPDNNVELLSVAPAELLVNGADIIETVGTADIETGQVYYVCLWQKISGDGNVVAA